MDGHLSFVARLARSASRLCFIVGGGLLAIGIHRVVFGVHPKLIWVRDLPWERVNASLCFVAALALATLGAILGRESLRGPTHGGGGDADHLTDGLQPPLPHNSAASVVPRSDRASPLRQPNER